MDSNSYSLTCTKFETRNSSSYVVRALYNNNIFAAPVLDYIECYPQSRPS